MKVEDCDKNICLLKDKQVEKNTIFCRCFGNEKIIAMNKKIRKIVHLIKYLLLLKLYDIK